MLIKSVDDKSRRIAFLLNLYDSPMLSAEQRKWLDDTLWSIRRNFLAEENSASFIDACFAESKDFAVLHDLRLHLRDGASRIDHLLLTRTRAFVIETRHFEGNIVIDERGDFTIEYPDSAPKTIEAPLKRGERLETMLQEFFGAMDIKVHGTPLPVHHLVMCPNNSTIRHPAVSDFDATNIVKQRALKSWVANMCSRHATGKLKSLWSREKDSLHEWGEKIVSHHHPDNPFYLPKFIRLKSSRRAQDGAGADLIAPLPDDMQQRTFNPTMPPEEANSLPPVPERLDSASLAPTELPSGSAAENSKRADSNTQAETISEFLENHTDFSEAPTEYLGIHPIDPSEAPTEYLETHAETEAPPTELLARSTDSQEPPAPPPPSPYAVPVPKDISTCAQCGRPLMRGMVKFCQEHPKRFGGQLYCFTHQNNFPPVPEEDA